MAAREKKKILATRFTHAISVSVHYRDLEHTYVYWIWLRGSASYVIIISHGGLYWRQFIINQVCAVIDLLTGHLIFRAVAEPRILGKSAKSREIPKNTRNPAKFARNLTRYMSAQHIWKLSWLFGLLTCCKFAYLQCTLKLRHRSE